MTREQEAPPEETFVHAALIIDSDECLRDRLVPVLRRSLDRGEPVLMIVREHTAEVVRDVFGDRIEWGAHDAFDERLGLVYQGFHTYLAAQHARGRRVHVVAEPDITAGLEPDRAAAYLAYESVCNETLAGFGCPVTCVWDSRRHPTLVVEGVRSLHSHEITDEGDLVIAEHVTPQVYLTGRNAVPLPPPPAVTGFDVTLTHLDLSRDLRAMVRSWATGHSFGAVAEDLVLAVAEVAENGLIHGAAPVRVRGWERARTLVVQVDDAGARPLPPTAGFLPPGDRPEAARGLWLARQLADIVLTHTGRGVTSVRLHFPYDVTHRRPAF
ncbi:MEDS domain-containing protein [Catenuloplanes sp. NPDC051500]|uniref:MEDS domain-containing protein n=1 Tax=Catenuloplanes sp. NPDC051500 TaxID=3363959 RepID=UPI00379E9B72